MTRPRSHDTEEASKRIFESSLPPDWQPREQKPDYRIDYQVEIFENEQPTGRVFAVQLKGTESMRYSGQSVPYRLKVEHLAYYLDHVRLPAFLVYVDVRNKTGYWCFLQEYALDVLAGKDWRKKRTVTISIPVKNSLNETARLRQAVETACHRITALYPSAIPVALSTEQQRLESLDPRFQVKVDAGTQSGIHYTVNPKETVTGKILIKGDAGESLKKAQDLFHRGLPVTFLPGEVEFQGSPLWQHIASKGGTLHVTRKLAAILRFTRAHSDNFIDFTGEFEGGTQELRFSGSAFDRRINVQFTIAFESKPVQSRITFSFRSEQWLGRKVSQLPGLTLVEPFFRLFAGDSVITAVILFPSVPGKKMVLAPKDIEQVRQFSRTALAICKVRGIAERFGVDPMLPDHFGREEVLEIERVYELVHNREHVCDGSRLRLRAEI